MTAVDVTAPNVASMDIDIVPLGPAEAAAMAPIHAAAFGAEAWDEAALARLLRTPAAWGYGAYAGYARTPLGLVLALAAADEAEIVTIAVDPAHRRAGLGARLVKALVAGLQAEGIERLFLEVADDNAAALGLYRRLGFIETGRRKGYYARPRGPAVDARLLVLSIAADGRSGVPDVGDPGPRPR